MGRATRHHRPAPPGRDRLRPLLQHPVADRPPRPPHPKRGLPSRPDDRGGMIRYTSELSNQPGAVLRCIQLGMRPRGLYCCAVHAIWPALSSFSCALPRPGRLGRTGFVERIASPGDHDAAIPAGRPEAGGPSLRSLDSGEHSRIAHPVGVECPDPDGSRPSHSATRLDGRYWSSGRRIDAG